MLYDWYDMIDTLCLIWYDWCDMIWLNIFAGCHSQHKTKLIPNRQFNFGYCVHALNVVFVFQFNSWVGF